MKERKMTCCRCKEQYKVVGVDHYHLCSKCKKLAEAFAKRHHVERRSVRYN